MPVYTILKTTTSHLTALFSRRSCQQLTGQQLQTSVSKQPIRLQKRLNQPTK